VAEHRCAGVDGGRLPVPFAGHAHPAPLSQVLWRRRHRRQGRETQEEEKDREQTVGPGRRPLCGRNVPAAQAKARPDTNNQLRGRDNRVRVSGVPGRVPGQASAGGTPGQPRDGAAIRVRHLWRGTQAKGSLDTAPAEPQFREAVRLYRVRQGIQA